MKTAASGFPRSRASAAASLDALRDGLGVALQRREVDGHESIDLARLRQRSEGVREVLRGGGRREVDRVDNARLGQEARAQLRRRPFGELGKLEPGGLGRVGRQDGRTADVGHDCQSPTLRQRLMRQQARDVEHLLQGVGADDARVPEERVDPDVGRGQQRAGVGGCRPGSCSGTAGLHRHDRLPSGHAASDAAEFPRVPERFDVQQDGVGLRVRLPEVQQVVGGDVRLVP
jgi:hypothetical protein